MGAAILGVFFASKMIGRSYSETIRFILTYSFPTGISYTYNYITTFGILATLLCLFGLTRIYKKQKIYLLFWSIMGLYYLLSDIMPVTYYIEYVRIVYLLMIASIIPASFGMDTVMRKSKRIGAVCFILLFIVLQFHHYYSPEMDARDLRSHYHRYISETEYQAIRWLQESSIKEEKILSLPRIGSVLPLTGNYPTSRIRLMHGFPEEVQDSKLFFKSNCDKKKEIIDKYDPKYVVSKDQLHCGYLHDIFRKGLFVYQIQENS